MQFCRACGEFPSHFFPILRLTDRSSMRQHSQYASFGVGQDLDTERLAIIGFSGKVAASPRLTLLRFFAVWSTFKQYIPACPASPNRADLETQRRCLQSGI